MKTDPALWAAISAHDIDLPGAALPFSRRLARDNGWSEAFAAQAIAEYRRFAYLACVSLRMVTPSEEVDAVWHLHLIYTRDYWERFCGEVLKRPLHHNPTEGGAGQGVVFDDAYRGTLDLYRREFGAEPPAALWPSPEKRFAPPAPTSDAFHLPKRQVFLCLAAAGAVLTLAGCDIRPVIGEVKAHPMLTLMFVFIAMIMIGRMLAGPAKRRHNGDSSSGCGTGGCSSSDSGGDGGSGCGSSGCGGGCGGD